MASLDNIFDSPTPPRPARRTEPPESPISPIAPYKRRNEQALFDTYSSASESDNAGPSRRRQEQPRKEKTNRNAAAVEAARRAIAAIDEGSDLDLDEPPAGAAPVAYDPLAGMDLGGAGDDDDAPVKKKRVIAKVDPDRLLGPNGLTALVRQAKAFKVKGKGHETRDLKNLMELYQLWAHQMFPKATFRDTVGRVEKVCSARRMEVALSGIIDAQRPRSPSPPLDAEGIDDTGVPQRALASPARSHEERQGSAEQSTARRLFEPALSVSRSPSPRRMEEEEEDNGPSIEELMAMEEEQEGWDAMEDVHDEPSRVPEKATTAPAVPGPEDDDYDDLYD